MHAGLCVSACAAYEEGEGGGKREWKAVGVGPGPETALLAPLLDPVASSLAGH